MLNQNFTAVADAALAEAVSDWLQAHTAYGAAYALDASEDVTGAANSLVSGIETKIKETRAVTMSGVASKLAIVDRYLKVEDDDGAEDRASAMSLSIARDLIAMSRALPAFPMSA